MQSWATTFGTLRPYDLLWGLHKTALHHTIDEYPDGPPKFWLEGQAHPTCQESDHRCMVSPSGLPSGAMQFNSSGSYCGQGMDWWHEESHSWWQIVQAYCIFFGQPNISKMYFSHWKTPGVSERMWSVILDASISGEYQTLGGHSCRPSE